MQKKSASESGALNPRIFIAFLLCSAAAWIAVLSFATPSPANGTLSRTSGPISYTDSTGAPPNLTHVALGKPNCGPSNAACSIFNLTIDPSITTPTGDYNPANFQLLFQWNWAVATVDFDIFVEDAAGNLVAKNTSTADPSSIIIPAKNALATYKLVVVLATGAPIPYTGTVTLEPAGPSSGLCNPALTNCAPPRYENYPAGQGQADGAGEPSLGVDFNPNVATLKHDKVNTGGVAFFTANRTEWRVNFDDCSSPAINLWEDVSAIFTQEFVLTDPIGFVDHYSSLELGTTYPPPQTPGRVFSLDLIGGQGNSFASYSDDDGNSYLPGGNGGPGAGPDHETLGGGPYSANQTIPISHPNYPNAIYYCSQNIVAEAQCSRSDDGGQTFGPGIPIFSPNQCTGGIHGHVKVARDGTVYVPNSSCGTTGTAGVAVSTDNGLTWTENNVTDSTSSQDPSVGIGQNDVGKPAGQTTNTIYVGYVDGDGHAKVVVSGDRGANYSQPVDVGEALGVTHAVFPVVVAGDDNRAAFAFIGTGDGVSSNASPCNVYGATLNCKNIWHLYVATTYDRGANWITVDATPTDAVQQGVVCLEGTSCLSGRNLLDFNDFAIDSQGRGLVGWADGCVNCTNTFIRQSTSAHGTVTRQSGGRRLFAFFDPTEPAVPAAPQLLSATDQAGGVLVSWLEPDNGGSPITSYKVYRGTASGAETFLASVTADNLKYLDATPPAGPDIFYYVTAVNSIGEGGHCRELSLGGAQPNESSCSLPYITVAGPGSPGNLPTDPTLGELSIERVGIGEPFTTCTDNSITFLMKVETLDPGNTGTAALPPNGEWQVLFGVTDTQGRAQTVYVEMDTFNGLPEFQYGRRDPSATGGTLDSGQCTSQPGNPLITCPAITGSYAADGTIIIKLNVNAPLHFDAPTGATGVAFDWDPRNPGSKLTAIKGNTFLFVGAGAGLLETVTTTSGGDYTRVGNTSCNSAGPTASLDASPRSGSAPLNVTFDGSASSEPAGACGTINSYTMNFGDGSPEVTQSSPTFMHTYTTNGDFPASLKVKDTKGLQSTNVAQIIITVADNTPPVADLRADPTAGDPPLTVHFDATHSSDPDFSDTIDKYTYRFGDGTPDVVGGPVIDHTYMTAGTFAARLVVTDSRGAESENIAEQIITVTGAQSPTPSPTASGSPGPSATPTASPTATATATASPTASATATASPTATATATASPIATATATATASPSATATATASPSATATATASPTATATATASPSATATATASPIATATATASPSATATATASPTATVTATASPIATATATASPSATATATASPSATATATATPTGTPTATPANVQLVNISGRVLTQTGDKVGIGGFIISGSTSKRIMARAIGPSMKVNGTPVQGRLTDPVLELHDSKGSPALLNDNWRSSQETEIAQSGLAPSDDKESAIIKRLPPGNYTAIIRSADGSAGIGLIELYDLSANEPGELGNLAVRAQVETGDNVLIDGLIMQGGTPKRILFRALGPSVKVNGTTVPGALQDPTMEVYDGNGTLLRANDNWKDAPNMVEIQTTGLAPPDDHESAALLLLPPGNYTSVVRGVGGTTGISLNEVYKLNN